MHNSESYSKLNYQHFEIANLHLKQLEILNFYRLIILKHTKFSLQIN